MKLYPHEIKTLIELCEERISANIQEQQKAASAGKWETAQDWQERSAYIDSIREALQTEFTRQLNTIGGGEEGRRERSLAEWIEHRREAISRERRRGSTYGDTDHDQEAVHYGQLEILSELEDFSSEFSTKKISPGT